MKLFYICIFLVCFAITCAKILKFSFLKTECLNCNPERLNLSCTVHNPGTIQSSADVDVYLFRPLNNVLVHMALWKKLNGNFVLTPINLTINACRYANKDERVPFHANLVMKWVTSFSNINHSCPYDGHMYVRNLRAGNFRMVIPDGEYRLDVKIYEKSFSEPLTIMRGYGKKV